MLVLRTDSGVGRIVFRDGLVRSAWAVGGAEDLCGLLTAGGHVSEAEFKAAAELARERACPLDEALTESTDLDAEHLLEIRQQHVEDSVIRMFAWISGEFSFDIREELEQRDRDFLLTTGINTQHLAMEAARLSDEASLGSDDDLEFSGSDDLGLEFPDNGATDEPSAGESGSSEDRASASFENAEPAHAASEAAPAENQAASGPTCTSLIAIDPDLDVLEWIKEVMGGLFVRVHIFQRADGGVTRIRQYLLRGETPLVLLAVSTPPELADGGGLHDLVARLHTQAPHMPILLMHEEASEAPKPCEGATAMVVRPASNSLGARCREEASQALREAVKPWTRGS
jgi:hypothetical protein